MAPAQAQYRAILEQASNVVYVSRTYKVQLYAGTKPLSWPVHASILLAVYNGTQRSGTGATVNYARKLGRKIIVIDPLTRSVSYEGGGT